MRIALVHMRSARVGGTESYVNQIARHLAERGHETVVVCRTHEDAPHPSVRFVELRSLAPGRGLRMLAFARDVERHLRETTYDLVVGLGRTATQDVLRVSGGCHATYLERAHEHTLRGPRLWLSKVSPKHRIILDLEARALAPGAYRCVIVNSDLVRRDVVARYGVDTGKIRLIRNGVDLERFHPRHREAAGRALRKELGLDDADPAVLFLGSGYGRKGLDVLLEAFPRLASACPRAKLVVAGADPDLAGWQRRARDLDLESRAIFLGKRPDADALYGAADLYVLPTRYDSYAYTVLEALATGIPVVVSDGAGASEVVDASSGAVLPWTADPEALASALAAWAPRDRRLAAASACRRIAEENGADAAAERTVALFEDLARTGSVEGTRPRS